jgi:hypothetical protein
LVLLDLQIILCRDCMTGFGERTRELRPDSYSSSSVIAYHHGIEVGIRIRPKDEVSALKYSLSENIHTACADGRTLGHGRRRQG